MTRMTPCSAAAVVFVLAIGAPAHSQTLGDAAKLAEDQRKAQSGPSLVITSERDLHEVKLTEALVRSFASARSTLSGLYARDPAVYESIRAGAQKVKHFRDFAAVLEQQPKVVESLKIFEFDPAGFVLTEATIRRSLNRAAGEEWAFDHVEQQNTIFVRSHQQLARDYADWRRRDGGHWFWPDLAAYW
jgi:hypothetical protein